MISFKFDEELWQFVISNNDEVLANVDAVETANQLISIYQEQERKSEGDAPTEAELMGDIPVVPIIEKSGKWWDNYTTKK